MASNSGGQIKGPLATIKKPMRRGHMLSLASLTLILSALYLSALPAYAGQAEIVAANLSLPESPEPQTPASSPDPKQKPCPRTSANPPSVPSPASGSGSAQADVDPSTPPRPAPNPCASKLANLYSRFVDGPLNRPLTPKDKAWLAARNMVDPFNAITILGEAGISVGADSHSPYGPGMPGYARYVGVSFTQELTGEFFGTFLIPSIARQDPHYHRLPNAKIPRRIGHAIFQVLRTQGDNGKPMPNYANIVGFAIDDAISDLYVPGRETTLSASATRYATGFATAPISNFVTEFLPDVARHIHIQIFIIQRIINRVARNEGGQP